MCSKCGFKDYRNLNALDASFESTREWSEPCIKCGSEVFSGSGSEIPPLTTESLTIWGNNEQIYFMDQDEDIIMADEINIELITIFIDNLNILESKRSVLLSALCVLLFDNLPDEEDSASDADHDLAVRVKNILLTRLNYFEELNTINIYDYIKEVVYPELGLEYVGT